VILLPSEPSTFFFSLGLIIWDLCILSKDGRGWWRKNSSTAQFRSWALGLGQAHTAQHRQFFDYFI
jgi:hypothetical protein